jgi:hypothetical protein
LREVNGVQRWWVLIAVIALVMEVEGEGKWKGRLEDGTAAPFRWNGGAWEANSGAMALVRRTATTRGWR